MKKQMSEQLEIPAEISCEVANNVMTCKKGSTSLSRKVDIPGIVVSAKDNKIFIECESGNQRDFKTIKSYIAHVKNMFEGLNKGYTYHLESVTVHFPVTLKVEGNRVSITNFLGEKKPRFAQILPGVKVEIKGQKITVTSPDKESAGHTVANLERATKIRKRDRRIFQDGIFLTDRPGGAK